MIGNKMLEALNAQINKELYSSYLYLSMSAWFESENWRGMAKWMALQAKEENAHAMKLFNFVIERGGQVALDAIAKPQAQWAGPLAAFEDALKHERFITKSIHELVEVAAAEKDYAASNLLQWFVNEQVEEEANAEQIVHSLKLIKESANGLFMLDHQLGKRE